MRLAKFNLLARAVSDYVDELYEAEKFGLSAEKWWQETCTERHKQAAELWAKEFGQTYEEAYRQFAVAVGMVYSSGQLWQVGVTAKGMVTGVKLVYSATTCTPAGNGGPAAEVPGWVWERYPNAMTSGSAHLVNVFVEEVIK